jgi:hypothetical protein
MIKPAKIVELMGLDVDGMSKLLNKSGYDGLGDDATLVFAGLNEDGHFTYRAKDFDVDEGSTCMFLTTTRMTRSKHLSDNLR